MYRSPSVSAARVCVRRIVCGDTSSRLSASGPTRPAWSRPSNEARSCGVHSSGTKSSELADTQNSARSSAGTLDVSQMTGIVHRQRLRRRRPAAKSRLPCWYAIHSTRSLPCEIVFDGISHNDRCSRAGQPLGVVCCASRWTMRRITSTPTTARTSKASEIAQPRVKSGAMSARTIRDARGDAVGRPAVLQGRLRGASRLDCASSVTDEPDSDQRHDAEGDPDPGAVDQHLRQDAPRVACRRLGAVVLDQVVDEVAARGAPYGQHQEPDGEHADPERAQLEPATPAGKPDRERRDSNRDEPHPVGDCAENLGDRPDRLQLALVGDRDSPGGGGSLSATFRARLPGRRAGS